MSKLTKAQVKAHAEAERILTQDRLTDDERLYVLENWQESARHINSSAGAFFTPFGLARDFAIEVPGGRILDLCAGIGTLGLAVLQHHAIANRLRELVCVEINPDYAAVGRKLLPEARWIEADVFALPSDLGRFDCALANPPFGNVSRSGKAPRYAGGQFELHVIDVASDLADHGVFIVPQATAPFRYSGEARFLAAEDDDHRAYTTRTGIRLEPSCGIDTSLYRADWRGAAPRTEIVLCDLVEARAARAPRPVAQSVPATPGGLIKPTTRPAAPAQPDLFEAA